MLLGNVAQFCVLFPPLGSFLVVFTIFMRKSDGLIENANSFSASRRRFWSGRNRVPQFLHSQTLLYKALQSTWNENDVVNFLRTVGFLQSTNTCAAFWFWNVQCSCLCLFNEVKAFWKIYLLWSVFILWLPQINKYMGNTSHSTTSWAQLLSTYHLNFNCVCSRCH